MSELRYNCTDIELLLCDYLDRALPADQNTAFEGHIHSCSACVEMVADCRAAMGFVERCETVEPPAPLLTRILNEIPVAREEQKRRRGFSALIHSWFAPIFRPRFAMGMAMTILSFSMLGKFVGPVKPIKAADLDPIRVVSTIDDKIHRGWNNVVKYYESLRFVYEIQTRLREWSQEQQEEDQGQAKTPQQKSGSEVSGGK